jgi:hypothetical protein
MQCDFDAGDAFNPSDAGAGQDVDAFSVKELLEGLRDVGIFAMGESRIAFDDGDPRAEAAHRLGKFKTDEPSAHDDQVFRHNLQLQGFHVGERFCLGEAGRRLQTGTRAGIDEHSLRAKHTLTPSAHIHLDGSFADKATESQDNICSALREVGEVKLVEAVHHRLTPGADTGHVDVPLAVDHTELLTALEVRSDFGAVDDVLGGQACDIGTGAANVILFDCGYPLPPCGEMPPHIFSSFSGTQNDCVVVLRWRHQGSLPRMIYEASAVDHPAQTTRRLISSPASHKAPCAQHLERRGFAQAQGERVPMLRLSIDG